MGVFRNNGISLDTGSVNGADPTLREDPISVTNVRPKRISYCCLIIYLLRNYRLDAYLYCYCARLHVFSIVSIRPSGSLRQMVRPQRRSKIFKYISSYQSIDQSSKERYWKDRKSVCNIL